MMRRAWLGEGETTRERAVAMENRPDRFVSLLPDEAQRSELWQQVGEAVEELWGRIKEYPVKSPQSTNQAGQAIEETDFAEPRQLSSVVASVVDMLMHGQVQTVHPSYFGLFNPAPTFASVLAETLVGAFSPQLGSCSHAPIAIDIERRLVKSFGERFGYCSDSADGVFTTGGAEANQTAVIAAIVKRWPEYLTGGSRSLPGQPTVYFSSQTHHSVHKAVRCSGLGSYAIRELLANKDGCADAALLQQQIESDRREGYFPFMLIGNLGTTMSGAIDPLRDLAQLAQQAGLWFHIDAAWGGAAVLSPRLAPHCSGSSLADSITFDPHKWLAMPAACGLFLTRHPGVLATAFTVSTGYMPQSSPAKANDQDPFRRSLQWTRRFNGLKLFITLASIGWRGYEQLIDYQTDLGWYLRSQLVGAGWDVTNTTELPLVCFRDGEAPWSSNDEYHRLLCDAVVEFGRAWISTVEMPGIGTCLRACITNYRTTEGDVESLIRELELARSKVRPQS